MKQWKKHGILALIICILMVGSNSAWMLSVETVHADSSFSGGLGTEENPYEITTAEELNEIRKSEYRDLHFVLMDHIDLSKGTFSEWEPIDYFSGSLNGDGHRITGLNINSTSLGSVGLFANMDGEIKNLEVDANEVRGMDIVGILVGSMHYQSRIHNVSVTGAVYGRNRVGGLIGNADTGVTVSDSQASGHVNGHDYVGGLIGLGSYDTSIPDSWASSDVTGNDNVGGLVGYTGGDITDSWASGDVTGNDNVGGLIGRSLSSISISGSSATGGVTGNDNVGGLIGFNNLFYFIYESHAEGDITGSEGVGGLVGNNTTTDSISRISKSYAEGSVTGIKEVGGLVGHVTGGGG